MSPRPDESRKLNVVIITTFVFCAAVFGYWLATSVASEGRGARACIGTSAGTTTEECTECPGTSVATTTEECRSRSPAAFSIEKQQEIAGSGRGFTVSPLTGKIGQTVDYRVTVRNTGVVPLGFSGFTDRECQGIKGGPGAKEVAPGESTTYTCDRVLAEVGKYANTATDTGTPPTGGGETVTDEAVTDESNTVTVEVHSAPSVTTTAATEVKTTTAKLHGTVNPNGQTVTKCTFEYGTNLSYGSSVPCSSLPGSGTTPVAVSAAVSGLKTGTGYFVRISATNASGTTQSSYSYFKTPEPTVAIQAPTEITGTTAKFNAKVDPEGSNVTKCTFEYGTNTSYGSSVQCTSLPGSGTTGVPVSATATGLKGETGYFVRISETNAKGTVQSTYAYFKTLEVPVVIQAPTEVTGTTAKFHATVDPGGSSVTKCTFEYGTNLSYGSSVSCSSLPGSGTSPVAVSASASGLKPGTGYFVRISETNAKGTSESTYFYFKTLA